MPDRYRIVVHHVSTDNYWYGCFERRTEEQLINITYLLKSVCETGEYLNLKNEQGSTHFFPKNLIQECVFTLEKSHEND